MALLFEAWLWPPAVAPVSITGQLRSLCLAARHICLSRGRRLSIYSQMSVFTSRLLTADAEQCVTGFGKCDEKKTLEEKSIDRRNVWLTKISESEAGAEGHLIIFWQLFRLKFKGSQMVHLFRCDLCAVSWEEQAEIHWLWKSKNAIVCYLFAGFDEVGTSP